MFNTSVVQTTWQSPTSGGLVGASDPTNGTTGANISPIGSFYTNTTSGQCFINVGTQASPQWGAIMYTEPGS